MTLFQENKGQSMALFITFLSLHNSHPEHVYAIFQAVFKQDFLSDKQPIYTVYSQE